MKQTTEIIKGTPVTFTIDRVVLQDGPGEPAQESPHLVCYFSVNPAGGFLGELIRDSDGRVVVFTSEEEALEYGKRDVRERMG